jgi:DNA-binding transcriptional regulator YhcF (GntR family)
MTILFYNNDVVNNTIVQQNINGTYIGTTNSAPGIWQCQVSATDGANTTIVQSNIVTISERVIEQPSEPKPSRGGGGGGGIVSTNDSSNDKTKNIPPIKQENTTKKNPQKALDEPVQENITPIIQETIPSIIEQPRTVSIWGKYWKMYLGALILFILASIIIIKTGKSTNPDERINDYIIQSLNSGYSYAAIRKVLKKYYKEPIIDHHFYLLRKFNLKPSKIRKIEKHIPKERQKEAKESISAYIEKQKSMGYAKIDIKKVLIQNGYPKQLVTEAIENA